MKQLEIDQELKATFETIKRTRPVYAELVERFQDLLQVQESCMKRFSEYEFDVEEQDPERARQGVSLLADAELPDCGDLFQEAREAVFPVLKDSFPIKEEIEALEKGLDDGKADLEALARSFLKGEGEIFQKTADDLGISAPVLVFAVRSVLGPVLGGMARSIQEHLDGLQWTQGYCPVCGSAPAAASLTKFDNKRNEELVGGGGKKRLICSLCTHQWNFRRDHCPACGNDDHKTKELLFAEDSKHERIEACKKCGSYLLCLDLREVDGNPRMEAVPLGLVHLDIIAGEHKYSPMAEMPWNTVE